MSFNHHLPVLMFGWELPPYNTGGLGVACYGLSKGLSQMGAHIAFALPRQLPTNLSFVDLVSTMDGVKITAINSLLTAYLDETGFSRLRGNHDGAWYGTSIYEEAMRFGDMALLWAKTQPHEIIHAHDWMSYPAAMKAHRYSGKPWIAHVHATEFDRTGGNVNQQIADIEYQGLQDADRIIAVSRYTKDVIEKRYSIAGSKIEVIHNGVNMAEFKPMAFRRLFPQDKVVLFVGRLTFQKGVEYFLQAAKEVLSEKPQTVFLVVGAGDLEQRLIMDASYMGIGHRVLFPGFMSGQNLRALYAMADVFVMPSISEPYGIVALEAVASGTPAIISKQSGVAETLSHVFKVDFWDTAKMSRLIVSALSHPYFAREMAGLAREEAARMTWQSAAEKTMRVYEQVLT